MLPAIGPSSSTASRRGLALGYRIPSGSDHAASGDGVVPGGREPFRRPRRNVGHGSGQHHPPDGGGTGHFRGLLHQRGTTRSAPAPAPAGDSRPDPGAGRSAATAVAVRRVTPAEGIRAVVGGRGPGRRRPGRPGDPRQEDRRDHQKGQAPLDHLHWRAGGWTPGTPWRVDELTGEPPEVGGVAGSGAVPPAADAPLPGRKPRRERTRLWAVSRTSLPDRMRNGDAPASVSFSLAARAGLDQRTSPRPPTADPRSIYPSLLDTFSLRRSASKQRTTARRSASASRQTRSFHSCLPGSGNLIVTSTCGNDGRGPSRSSLAAAGARPGVGTASCRIVSRTSAGWHVRREG